jgi:hypothetical protein
MTAARITWIPIICLITIAVAVLYVVIANVAPMPQDGQAVLYWLTLTYNYTALQAAIAVMLAAITALFFWIPQAIVKGPTFKRDGMLIGLALVAMLASVWAALPLGRLIYRDWAGVQAGGQSYRLGLRVSPDPAQNAYVFLECDRFAFLCQSQYLYDESLSTLNPLPTVTFDATLNKVLVQIESRTIYAIQP